MIHTDIALRRPITTVMVFLAVLTIGFAYEWKKGALEWE